MGWNTILIALAIPAAASPAQLPAPVWRGVDRIMLACDAKETAGLCAAALAEARRGSPVPVQPIGGEAGVGTINLRVSLAEREGETLITLSGERAAPIDESQGPLLPRSTRVRPGESVESALSRAFDALLPWRGAERRPSLPREV